MDFITWEMRQDPLPFISVTVLPGSSEVTNTETLVNAFQADHNRKHADSEKLFRFAAFDPASLALKKDHRRQTFSLPGNPLGNSGSGSNLSASASGGMGTNSGGQGLNPNSSNSSTSPSIAAAMDAFNVRGVMRTNWFRKKMEVIPAAVLVFAALPRLDSWSKVESEIVSFYSSWRAVARYRGIKFVFVISFMRGTESFGGIEERVNNMRRRADIDAKNIIIFAGQPEQFVAHTRPQLADIVNSYYKEEAKRLKQLAKSLPRYAPFQLHARIAIKTGFIMELAGEYATALKHYQTAFARFHDATELEIRKPESLLLHEIKIVAWHITYRMCMLHFIHFHHLPEAVRCFLTFFNTFRHALALPAFGFVHAAWLATCHEEFARLLLTFPNASAGNRGSMHPWSYFNAAARFMRQRVQLVNQQCKQYKENPSILAARDALVEKCGFTLLAKGVETPQQQRQHCDYGPIYETRSQYYGQFTQWKTKDERELGNDAFRTMAWELFFFDHNDTILALYNRAFTLLKAIPYSTRSLCQVQTEIARQYADQGDWEQAKQFCDVVTQKYTEERWMDVLADIKSIARSCVMNMRNTKEFIDNSLDLLLPSSPLTKSSKQTIQSQMEAVLSGVVNETVNTTNTFGQTDDVATVLKTLVLQQNIIRPVRSDTDLLKVSCRFLQPSVFVLESAVIEVVVTSFFPSPIIFNMMHIFFTDSRLDFVHHHAEQSLTEHLRFAPNVPRTFHFGLRPNTVQDIACKAVELTLGSQTYHVILHWDNPDVVNNDAAVKASGAISDQDEQMDMENVGFKDEKTGVWLKVAAKESVVKLGANYAAPALCGELFRFTLSIRNDDSQPVSDTRISFTCNPQPKENIFFIDPQGTKALPVLAVSAIPAHAGFEQPIFLRVRDVMQLEVTVNVTFRSAAGVPCVTALQERLSVQEPFTVSFSTFTESLQPIDMMSLAAHGKKPFYVCATAKPSTPYPLNLFDAKLSLTAKSAKDANVDAFTVLSSTTTSTDFSKGGIDMSPDVKYIACFLLQSNFAAQNVDQPGSLTLHCKRFGGNQDLVQVCPLPMLRTTESYVTASHNCSTTAQLGKPVIDTIILENHTSVVSNFNVVIDMNTSASTDFMLSGPSVAKMTLLPRSNVTLPITFIPLRTGILQLPDLHVTGNDQHISCSRMQIFVK